VGYEETTTGKKERNLAHYGCLLATMCQWPRRAEGHGAELQSSSRGLLLNCACCFSECELCS
jgi:hypothetical protein